jgi:hypothetical protein
MGGLVRYFSDERVRIFNGDCRRPISQHCSRITYNPARVDWLQLKPSKCPLRIRSPIGDGARLTGFLGGLLRPFNGVLPLVGLLGKAVFGGTAGGWSLPPNPGLENDVLRERRRKRPLARSWRSPATRLIGWGGFGVVQEVVARRWILRSGAVPDSWVSSIWTSA